MIVRRTILAVALAASVLCAAAAGASVAKTVKIPASVVFRTAEFPTANDPQRCIAVSFAQFPNVAKATSYSVLARGFKGSSDVAGGGPPFRQDVFKVTGVKRTGGPMTITLRAPAGKHWFVLGTSSTGQGCKVSLAGLEGRFAIARATATVG